MVKNYTPLLSKPKWRSLKNSSDFDALLNGGGEAKALKSMDEEMLQQGQEVLRLRQEANDAYSALITKYDEAVPFILAKHF